MKKYRLNKFVIISVAFHLVLISAVLLYFLKNPISGGKSGTVMIGIIGTQESVSSSSDIEKTETNKSESQKEISRTKIALDQKQPKESIDNRETIKKDIQKETPKTSKKEIKQLSSANTKKRSSTQSRGTETASIGQRGNNTNKAPGAIGAANTLAYPDYSHNPKPKYPRAARKRGYKGEVKLKVFVLSDGKVGKIEVLRPSGYKILDDEAVEAVKDWIFIPGKQDGKEISSWVTVPITFQLKSG